MTTLVINSILQVNSCSERPKAALLLCKNSCRVFAEASKRQCGAKCQHLLSITVMLPVVAVSMAVPIHTPLPASRNLDLLLRPVLEDLT